MKIKTKKADDRVYITLSENLNVRSAALLKQALEESVRSSDDVVVGFDVVDTVDLTFLQLICSAARTAREDGKRFSLEGDVPDIIVDLLESTGYNNHCSYSDHECVWNCLRTEEAS